MSTDFSKWKRGVLLKDIVDGEILLILKESVSPIHSMENHFFIVRESDSFREAPSSRRAGTVTSFLFENRVRVIDEI